MIHERLSHFEILERLGSGGMGTVYLARDLDLHRTVALKTLPETGRVSREARLRLLAEARAASALNHDAIVTIYEVGSDRDVDYIAMERVDGRPLSEIIALEGPLSEARVLDLAGVLADALATAHDAGVIHRDLKPSNVMVTGNGRLKILDFGLAKRRLPGDDSAANEMPTVADPVVTAEGVVLGTPAYMAPEQARGRAVDHRADLFALGAILYEALTGRRAFAGETPLEVVSAVLRDRPPPPSTVRSELDPVWNRFLERLLAKDPADRPADARAVLDDLEELRAAIVPGAAPARVGRLTAIGLVLATALVGLLFLWTLDSRRAASESPEAASDTFPEYAFRLLADLPGSQRSPAFSPDGNLVAFVQEDGDGVAQVWVSDLAGGKPVQVTNGERPADHPVWDPGGGAILFERAQAGIWEVPPLGGDARRLLEEGARPAISPDGKRIAYVNRRGLWLADREGGDARQIPGLEPTYFGGLAFPAFSPDGTRILTFWPHSRRPLGDLWTVPVAGGVPTRLTDLHFLSWGSRPVWSEDGEWIVFSSDHEGAVNLWRISSAGGEPRSITRGAGGDFDPDLTGDSRRLIYANGRNVARIDVHDPVTNRHRTVYERRDLLITPEVSPDGGRAAFFARSVEGFHLYVADLESGQVRQVTHGEGVIDNHPVWSEDGNWLYYYQQEPTLSYRRTPAGGGESELVIDDWTYTDRNRTRPSPDLGSVVYTVRETGALVEARIRDLESGEETLLPLALYAPRWSRDGESVYGTTWDPPLAHRCPVEGGSCETLAEGWDLRLSPDERTLYVLRGSPPVVWSVDLATGREERLHEIEGYDGVDFGWGIGAGGEIVHHSRQAGELELWLGEADGTPR